MDAQSWIKSLSISGNVYLDTLILAHVVPFFLSYASSLTYALSSFLKTFGVLLCQYICQRLSKWAFGTVVCNIAVSDSEYIFKVLQDTIFSDSRKDTTSDRVASCLEMVFGDTNWSDLSNEVLSDHGCRFFKASLKSSQTMPLQVTPLYAHEKMEQRSFAFKDEHGTSFRLTVKQLKSTVTTVTTQPKTPFPNDDENKATTQTIRLILRAFGTTSSIDRLRSNPDYITTVLNTFLCNRFDLSSRLHFTYELSLQECENTNRLINYLSNSNHLVCGNSYLLKISDESLCDMNCDTKTGDTKEDSNSKAEMHCNKFNVNFSRNLRVDTSHAEALNIVPVVGQLANNNIYNAHFWLNRYFPELHKLARSAYFQIFFHKKCVVILTRRSDSTQILLNIVSLKGVLQKYELSNIVSYLFDAVLSDKKEGNSNKKSVHIHKYVDGKWKSDLLDKRDMHGLFLTPSVEKNLISEIDNFVSLRPLYSAVQLSYKLGILLYGPPGTGKTTAIKTIAYEWQMDVYQIDVNDPSVNDHSIVKILNNLGSSNQKIVAIEDIDSAFADKEKVAQETRSLPTALVGATVAKMEGVASPKFLTYSGLLQALDGLCSNQTGVITIMSTNHIERLGDAIMREGRIDLRIYMGPCCRQQIEKMTLHFIKKRLELKEMNSVNEIDDLKDRIATFADVLCSKKVKSNEKSPEDESDIKPCQLQNYIMSRIVKVVPIFEDYEQLLFSATTPTNI